MTPQEIQGLRHALSENVAKFGKRFIRSGRTAEEWEQGRRNPDPLILAQLAKLRRRIHKSEDPAG